MSQKVAIVHTTPVTIDPLKKLANEMIPGCEVVNFVDDSILPQLQQNRGQISEVEDRLTQYYLFAEQVGADVILNACSSVGEVVAAAQHKVKVPIVRIDEPMAEKAIINGEKIGVVATLETTLQPTIKLLEQKAKEMDKDVQLISNLAEESYQLLLSGDQEGHDRTLVKVLFDLAAQVDVVVLAQASMARVVSTLPEHIQSKFLSSPQLGMERVRTRLEGISG